MPHAFCILQVLPTIYGLCKFILYIPYSGLFSLVEIFVKSWKRPLRIKFHGFKFRGTIFVRKHNVNFELGTRDANFGFDEERIARLSPERLWLHETRGKMEHFSLESCMGGYHVYKGKTLLGLAYLNENYWPRFLVVFLPCFTSLFTFSITTRRTEGDPTDRGTVNRAQVVKKSNKKHRLVGTSG